MNQPSIALVGISGVGKSTLLRNLNLPPNILHLQAIALIKQERSRISDPDLNVDDLRNGPILDNQALLVTAFRRARETHPGLAILDGHVVVDTPKGLVKIPASVFSSITVARIIVVHDHPRLIRERRLRDPTRKRPDRSEEEIASHQAHSVETAAGIALKLDCPLSLITPRHGRDLLRILEMHPM